MSRRTAITAGAALCRTKLQGYGRTFCHRLAGADGGAGHPAKPQRPHYAHSRHGAGRQFLRDAATIIHHGRLGNIDSASGLENYPNETPVISGGMHITNWTHGSGNEWQATLPSSAQYFEQLFYNGSGGCDRAWVALWARITESQRRSIYLVRPRVRRPTPTARSICPAWDGVLSIVFNTRHGPD